MKLLAAVLLVCLLVTGTVSAVSMNPGSVQAAKTIVPTTTQVPRIPASILPAAVATEDVWILVNIDSVPTGATVSTDGYVYPDQKTPIKLGLRPGTHTIVLSHAMYQDYTITLTLKAGMPSQYITANLKRFDISPVMARVTGSAETIQPGQAVTMLTQEPPGLPTGQPTGEPTGQPTIVLIQNHQVGVVTLVATTAPPVAACPNADWTCLSLAEAEQQFGYPYAQYGDEPCGYTESGDQTVAKYCCMDVPSSGSLSPQVLGAAEIKEGADIYIMNATWIEHAIVNKSPAAKVEPEAESTNPFQSFLKFLTNFLSGSAKPESRLEIVGFNPCPEPPGAPQAERLF